MSSTESKESLVSKRSIDLSTFNKKYYKNNKSKWKKTNGEKYECECGRKVSVKNKKRHEESKSHLKRSDNLLIELNKKSEEEYNKNKLSEEEKKQVEDILTYYENMKQNLDTSSSPDSIKLYRCNITDILKN